MDNAAKLINIISTLIERNEKLLQHIGDLEEYIHALECVNDFEEGEEFICTIEESEGIDFLNIVWENPNNLPKLEEIKNPNLWITRIKKLKNEQ